MPSELFDRLIARSIELARDEVKARPPRRVPPRLESVLGFARLPDRAKEEILAAIDDDPDFRRLVLDGSDEAAIGRVGMLFVERPDGWEEQIDRLVEAADEPIVERATDRRRLERRLETAESAIDRLRASLAETDDELARAREQVEALRAERDRLIERVSDAEVEAERLAEERTRAVGELKTTESVMARHVEARKRLEEQIRAMTAAQLSTSSVGGGVTDQDVRGEVDRLEDLVAQVTERLGELRRRATPERVPAARRMPLPLPPAVFDDSVEAADHLLGVPGVLIVVDGYNVTKEAQPDLALDDQRRWLENGVAGLAARRDCSFEVVFDGADVGPVSGRRRDPAVRVSFSPEGVEADDVIIERVRSLEPDQAVVVVSSDNRVRDGAAAVGANLLHSHQLIALL